MSTETSTYKEMAAQIVSSYVSRNPIDVADLPGLIQTTYDSLVKIDAPAPAPAEAPTPAVSVKKSVQNDFIVDLFDGSKHKMLKRHLATKYGMSPDEYRAHWGLASDYPMVAPSYAQKRSELAKAIGLGTKEKSGGAKRGRKAKVVETPAE